MDDSVLVRGFERLSDLLPDRQRFFERNRPLSSNPIRKRLTFNELEDERALFQSIDRADMRMIQRGKELCLAFETCEPLGIRCECIVQNFDRNVPLKTHIASAVHFPHTTLANQRG